MIFHDGRLSRAQRHKDLHYGVVINMMSNIACVLSTHHPRALLPLRVQLYISKCAEGDCRIQNEPKSRTACVCNLKITPAHFFVCIYNYIFPNVLEVTNKIK